MHLCSMLFGASATQQLTTVLLAGGDATGLLRVLASESRLYGIRRLLHSHSNHARHVQCSAQVHCMQLAPAEVPVAVWQHSQSENSLSRALGSSVAALRCLGRTPWVVGLQAYSSSSSSRGFATTTSAADDSDPSDVPRRRRRSATESNAAMRRTTVSKPAQH